MKTLYWVIAALVLANVGTAVAVVYAKHRNRVLFNELQVLSKERDQLDIEWGQLQLEQSTWATHGRIERIAREQLNMITPDGADVVLIKP
ncbi:MAG: cell division protein FtsL [Gammaproteobacteria bacterium]|nr:cell division protein FtsL [Gammaproteobacteria bacterium]